MHQVVHLAVFPTLFFNGEEYYPIDVANIIRGITKGFTYSQALPLLRNCLNRLS